MIEFIVVLGSAFWLGILTSVSPCPLATNIAAIAFLTKELSKPRKMLWMGLSYTLGRALTYLLLAMVLIFVFSLTPVVSNALQTYGNRILGPILIFVGMVLLDFLPFPSFGFEKFVGHPTKFSQRYRGLGGGFLLGVLFALSFCPVSAALFFGSLLPLAMKSRSTILVPFLFGVGTAISVVVVAILLNTGLQKTGKLLDQISSVERWARKITGILFLGIGIYYCLVFLWGMGGK